MHLEASFVHLRGGVCKLFRAHLQCFQFWIERSRIVAPGVFRLQIKLDWISRMLFFCTATKVDQTPGTDFWPASLAKAWGRPPRHPIRMPTWYDVMERAGSKGNGVDHGVLHPLIEAIPSWEAKKAKDQNFIWVCIYCTCWMKTHWLGGLPIENRSIRNSISW